MGGVKALETRVGEVAGRTGATPMHLRNGSVVMSPERAVAATANALSFSRVAVSQFVKQRWRLKCLRFEIDRDGRGEILYRFWHEKWIFHFFVLSDCFPAELKVDRNFGVNWDAVAVLCEGEWTPARERLLRRELPKARAGINDYDCLIYARGNRSGRLFDQVVDSLTNGEQPDGKLLAHIGYILRTTAFIGNGAIGTRPLAGYPADHPLKQPYHAQMCAGFLLREYVCDLVDRMAYIRNPEKAVKMAPAFRRYLGIGNSAATGLLPYLVHRPKIIQRWCETNEVAFARMQEENVRRHSDEWAQFVRLTTKAINYYREDNRDVLGIFLDSGRLADELSQALGTAGSIMESASAADCGVPVWGQLLSWADTNLHPETGETLRAILTELYPEVIESLADLFHADEYVDVDPGMSSGCLQGLISKHYAWALDVDISDPEATHYFWYRSKAAPLDMRRGVRGVIPADEHEMGTEFVRNLHLLNDELAQCSPQVTVAELLLRRPDLRYTVARVQSTCLDEYAELRTNFLDKAYSPYAAVRLLLAFYGMEKLTPAPPKSVRGALLQGAPTALDVAHGRDGDWPFPLLPESSDMVSAKLEAAERATLKICDTKPTMTLAQESYPRVYTISPTELARFSQKALQGHGLHLTASNEGGESVAFTQALFGSALSDLLSVVEKGEKDTSLASSADLDRLGDGISVLQASQRNALAVAQETLDLACAGVRLSSHNIGVVYGHDAVCISLLDRLVLQAARRGFVGCLLWWSPEGKESLGRARFAVSAPSSVGSPWFTAVEQERPSQLYRQIVLGVLDGKDKSEIWPGRDWVAAALHSVDTAQMDAIRSGFVMVCMDADMFSDSTDGLFGLIKREFDVAEEKGPHSVCLDGNGVQEKINMAMTSGLSIHEDDWKRLVESAAELLIDPEHEVTLRPDGLDPQAYL